ncbi:MAG: molybdopterin converting factor subunit 1 [Rhodoferax sp.]|nr:molybdopterin converting factor subunit 1 [Rhodoferax sp.]
MKITVRYFAAVREATGVSSESLQTDALTLGALRDSLCATSARHAEGLARSRLLRVARNQEMCDESEALSDGDEIAFFPPVTGG